jgi:6-phosphogluconolactonase (cycloisomerase 2 family)
VLDDAVSVIDLADPTRPVVLQTLRAGAGASGVSINRAGTLALVASTGEGTVTVFSIAGTTLSRVGQVQLDPVPGPVDVAISPDGTTALVTQRRGTGLWRLAINGTTVTNTGVTIATGGQPYGSVFSHDGRFAYNTNLLGRLVPDGPAGGRASGPRMGTITAIDLATNTVASTTEVGPTPEHVTLSPDGRYLQVTLINGTTASATSANYNAFGLIKVYRVAGAALTLVAEAKTGAWGQGATWSDDGRVILLQVADAKEIEVYRFDGTTLARDPAATLRFAGRPGAIATARSR